MNAKPGCQAKGVQVMLLAAKRVIDFAETMELPMPPDVFVSADGRTGVVKPVSELISFAFKLIMRRSAMPHGGNFYLFLVMLKQQAYILQKESALDDSSVYISHAVSEMTHLELQACK